MEKIKEYLDKAAGTRRLSSKEAFALDGLRIDALDSACNKDEARAILSRTIGGGEQKHPFCAVQWDPTVPVDEEQEHVEAHCKACPMNSHLHDVCGQVSEVEEKFMKGKIKHASLAKKMKDLRRKMLLGGGA